MPYNLKINKVSDKTAASIIRVEELFFYLQDENIRLISGMPFRRSDHEFLFSFLLLWCVFGRYLRGSLLLLKSSEHESILLLTAQPCNKNSFPSWCSPINKRAPLVFKIPQASNFCISFTNNSEEKKEVRSIAGRKLTLGSRSTRGTCPVPFCSPKILREEAETRTLADAVLPQRLTAWTSLSNSKH
jgi:hypothetical protein